jgi:multidrug transporter EmrE-like cation transporter
LAVFSVEDRRTEGEQDLGLGIGLALVCAVATQLGFLCKHRGAARAPEVRLQQPMRSARALFASRWFAIGMAVAAVAWFLHVAALALAPLSTVQAVLSTGVVMLAVMGDRIFGHAVSPRQWLGVAMTAAGLGLLVLTVPAAPDSGSAFAVPGLIAFEAATLALGTLLIAAPKMGAPAQHHGVLLGAAAGVLFGVSDVAMKALTGLAGDGALGVIASPWLPVAALASVLAFLASARGFQEGEAVPVIASTSTAANLTCIVGGIVVFGDALAAGILLGVQLAAFALVAAAALVTPSGHGRPVAA